MSRKRKNKRIQIKYTAIVFLRENPNPLKFDQWINNYTIQKGYFQEFLRNRHPSAMYFNLYDKSDRKFVERIRLG